MVYLVLEPRAATEIIPLASQFGWEVWLGSDAITEDDHKRLCLSGVRLTRFSYRLAMATPEVLADSLATIEEHHPGEIVWVQHVSQESER